jgi:glutamate racemase
VSLPVIGVIRPGAAKALKESRSKHMGIIATPATIASNAYARALKELDPSSRVISQACPLFVPLVEEGWLDNEVALETAKIYLSSFVKEKIDTLILGCTHYPLLKGVIQKVVGEGVKLIDSAEAAAAELKERLAEGGLLSPKGKKPSYQIYVTDLPAKFESVAHRFLDGNIPPVKRVEL